MRRRAVGRHLWTRDTVAALVGRESGVRLSLKAVGVYVKRWVFAAQWPMKRAMEGASLRLYSGWRGAIRRWPIPGAATPR